MNVWQNIISKVTYAIGKVHWAPKNLLVPDELEKIQSMLTSDYYIILTRRNNHLSTYFIAIGTFLLTGRWGYWSHSLLNTEDQVNGISDFRLIEAIQVGVEYTPFDLVFNVNGVALMKPKSMAIEDWTAVLDKAKTELGKPYDNLFNIADDKQLSCIELVRDALMAGDPDYAKNFANFEAMIAKRGNLTPDMIYDCGDFEAVYEVRRR